MKKFDIHKCSIFLITAALGVTALLNLFQPDRPTVSESENRTLAAFPAFSFSDFWDGTYTEGISAFFSDTFLEREKLVSLSHRMDALKGFSYHTKSGSTYAVLDAGEHMEGTEVVVLPDLSDKLSDAFAQLETETAPQPETEPLPPESEPIETEPAPIETEKVTETETVTEPVEIETEAETAAETEDGPPHLIDRLILSRTELSLLVGHSNVILISSEPAAVQGLSVSCRLTDKSVASLSLNGDGSLHLMGVAPGTCQLICSYGKIEARCDITVVEAGAENSADAQDELDFLAEGMFLYNDAVYTPADFSKTHADLYLRTAEYYGKLFGCRVSVVCAPVSAMVIDDPEILEKIPDQAAIHEKMEALAPDNVNFVKTYDALDLHRDEYLFFRTDHHWTALAAYYAYAAWAESVGLTPTPRSDMKEVLVQGFYRGSMFKLTQDERIRELTDAVYAWLPTKKHTMTITTAYGATLENDSCIDLVRYSSYMSFLAGDNPYTVIHVPENPQDQNVLVLKDSFGNVFVPYLCEHYGNIIVADTRTLDFDLYEALKDYGLTDIIFVNNVQAANTAAWYQMYLKAVGVSS